MLFSTNQIVDILCVINNDFDFSGHSIITFSQNDQSFGPPPLCLHLPASGNSPFLQTCKTLHQPEPPPLYHHHHPHHHYSPLTKTIAQLCYFIDSQTSVIISTCKCHTKSIPLICVFLAFP